MSEVALVWSTFPSMAEARRVADVVLDEQLAACVNILGGCTSVYRWNGAVEEAQEVPALFKTRPMLAARLRGRIEALHNYQLPVVESWSTQSSGLVTAWIDLETGA